MEKFNLPEGWKYEVFDKFENQIAKYYSALTDYGEMIRFSDFTSAKDSKVFAEFDDYINIKKQDLKNITFEQLLLFLKNIQPKEKQSKKDCLIQLLKNKQIKYDEGLWWDEAIQILDKLGTGKLNKICINTQISWKVVFVDMCRVRFKN